MSIVHPHEEGLDYEPLPDDLPEDEILEVAPRTQWQLFRKRFFRHKAAMFSGVVLILLCIACFGAHWLAPYPKDDQNILVGATPPSAQHLMGTDQLGRDELSEVMYAGQISLAIGISVALLSTIVGTAIGAIAGYFGRFTDQALMRFTDLFLVVPGIAILAIALQKFGHSAFIIVLVLAGLGWMYVARVVRGQVLSVKEKEFVEAAQAAGASNSRIINRHLLPNCIGPIVVNATLGVAAAIVTESTLSFLGFGVQPPTTSWGRMLSDAEGNYNNNVHLLYFPGMMILITVLCVNFLGDGLRDAFDPQANH